MPTKKEDVKMNKTIHDCKNTVSALTDHILDKAKTFTIADYAILEFTLISFGVLIGTAFTKYFKKSVSLLAAIFALGYLYLMLRLFLSGDDEDEEEYV